MHHTRPIALAHQAAAHQENEAPQPSTDLALAFAQNLQSLALQTHGLHIAPPRPALADLLSKAATTAHPFTRHA